MSFSARIDQDIHQQSTQFNMPNTTSQARMIGSHKSMVYHYGIVSTRYLSYLTILVDELFLASLGTFTGRNGHHRS